MAMKTPDLNEGGKSLLQFAAIVEDSHDAIIGVTPDGVVTSWNGGAVKMFGYSALEMSGKPFWPLIPPEMKDEAQALLDKVIKGGVVADHDSVRLRKDGSRVDVASSMPPIHSEDGAIIGASVVERDITERKRATVALAESEMRYRTLVEAADDQIFMLDDQCRFLAANGAVAALFRKPVSELLGKPITDFFPKGLAALLMANVNQAFKTGQSVRDFGERLAFGDRETFNSTTLTPVKNEKGAVVAVIGVVRDITERKRAEETIKNKVIELENSARLMTGRELKMVELKEEIKDLKKALTQLGQR